jgi:hypothetical protein
VLNNIQVKSYILNVLEIAEILNNSIDKEIRLNLHIFKTRSAVKWCNRIVKMKANRLISNLLGYSHQWQHPNIFFNAIVYMHN